MMKKHMCIADACIDFMDTAGSRQQVSKHYGDYLNVLKTLLTYDYITYEEWDEATDKMYEAYVKSLEKCNW